MSGIFKGDSIYKSGGGGGGYKDGGALVDGVSIEVKNNTISTFNNDSRSELHFYIDEPDDVIINSIINLYTEVNADIYVYRKVGNFYTLLGNYTQINTIAQKNYNINITGNSYGIEEVSNISNDNNYAIIGNFWYKIITINGVTWTQVNIYDYKNDTQCMDYVNSLHGAWVIPNSNDFHEAANFLNGFANLFDILDVELKGYLDGGGTIQQLNNYAYFWTAPLSKYCSRWSSNKTSFTDSYSMGNNKGSIRLVNKHY